MLALTEPINVWVYFKQNQITPFMFYWRNRQVKIDKVNLIHTSKTDGSLLYHFSVSGGENYYQLCFDLRKMKWLLEAVEEGE